MISIDIETTGLDHNKDRITCIGVWCKNYKRVYRDIEIFHYDFNKFYKHKEIVGQNFKFDIKFLVKAGINREDLIAAWQHDTQLMIHTCTNKIPESYLKWYEEQRMIENKKLPQGFSHRKARNTSLKTNAPYWLGIDPFWEDPSDHDNDEYVLKDCEYTYRLAEMFIEKLKENGEYEFYEKRMMPWAKMLLEAELRGLQLDLPSLEDVQQEFEAKAIVLKEQLDNQWMRAHDRYHSIQRAGVIGKYEDMTLKAVEKSKDKEKTIDRYSQLCSKALNKIPEKINYDSPKQMLWLLRDYLELPVLTYSGEESTGKPILEQLAKAGHKDIELFLEWRKTNKVLTSFLPTYRNLQHEGIIHPSFNLCGTRTGRLSSSTPNMQQVPPSLYKLFKPRPGYTFIQHDLAGIEAAIIALYSEDPMLYDIIDKGQSIHDHNCRVFFNFDTPVDKIKEVHPDERYASKHVGFALFYGAGKNRIKHTFANFGFMITDEQAREKHENFKEHYKQAISFHRSLTRAFEDGKMVSNLFGRPLKIQKKEDCFMKGFNTLVQSSASDLNLRAGELAKDEWKREELDCTILLLIHDFILAEVKLEHAEQSNKILVDKMTGFKLENSLGRIPLKVDGGVSDEWRK